MTSPPVQAALLATARPPAAAGADPAALAATLSSFNETDWSALVEHALAYGSASRLCRHLLAVGAELVPADVATACTTYLAARERVAADAVAQLAFVVDTLASDGINALPFKGPVLGLQAYGDPAMREYHDLDILIRREHLSGTLATLHDLGYRSEAVIGLRARRIADYYRYNGHDILFPQEELPLEPHWALSPRTFCAELDTGPIFDRAVVIETAHGRRFACFAPEDTLLAAAVHGGKEQWSRLVWVADIAALLHAYPAIDWIAILARAKQAGCLRMTLLAAELASELLGAYPARSRPCRRRQRSCRGTAGRACADQPVHRHEDAFGLHSHPVPLEREGAPQRPATLRLAHAANGAGAAFPHPRFARPALVSLPGSPPRP